MQTKQAPGRVLESVELVEKRGRQLLAPDQALERLMHVERRGDKLFRTHGAAVSQLNAGCPAVLDDNAADIDLRLERAAGGNEGLHQSARQVEGTALTELVAALQVEGANDRAHGRGLGERIHQPGAEQ